MNLTKKETLEIAFKLCDYVDDCNICPFYKECGKETGFDVVIRRAISEIEKEKTHESKDHS